MKKILLLGGSAQQVVAIETAKRLGCYTVLCDYLPDNPGQYAADKFYLVSTTDKQAVLEVAEREQVDGVLAYASDPAAPTAAYVAEKLGLPGNPYKSVDILCNKDKFRAFLAQNGFHTPKAAGYDSVDAAMADAEKFDYPVIVKPVDSSGSKGATRLYRYEDAKAAIEFAFSFSRGKRVIVEKYIEKNHPYLVGGDIFVLDGHVVMWGLMNCHRDDRVNPLVPVGKSYPPRLEPKMLLRVKDTMQAMVSALGICFGPMNVELIVDADGRVFPIDVGPRSGGNMIPDLLSDIFGVDVVEMTVCTAMGESVEFRPKERTGCFATHNIHSACDGVLEGVSFSDELKPYLLRVSLYKKSGERVERFDNASKCLGIAFMHFPDEIVMHDMLNHIYDHIQVHVKQDESET